MIRVGLLGARGRMGGWVSRLLSDEYGGRAELVATPNRDDVQSPGHGYSALLNADVVIDFSSPAGMLGVAEVALRTGTKLPAFVVGSTGWKPDERRKLEELGQRTPVLMASNFSTGVLAVQEILRTASPILQKLGYTPVIVETHHRHKKDAPSGTAITLQRMISPESPATVQTHSVRAGEIIGDHEVSFFGAGDHITIGHFAQDRSIFARGAIDVALWLATQRNASSPGLIGIEKYFEVIKAATKT